MVGCFERVRLSLCRMKAASTQRSRANLLLGWLAMTACGSEGSAEHGYGATLEGDGEWPVSVRLPNEREPEFEHVILITYDTLRADHVSSYGYFRKTTPFLDSLAERGAVFENAICSVSQTAPSHASIMTGLSLYEHGVSENGYALSPDANDLARVFSDAGYDTGAFLTVSFLSELAHHFDHVSTTGLVALDVFEEAADWLAAPERAERSFVWIHSYDPHRWRHTDNPPTQALESIKRVTSGSDEEVYARVAQLHGLPPAAPSGEVDLDWIVSIPTVGRIEGKTIRDYLDFVDVYDALIRYGDKALRKFHAEVEAMNLPGRALWIVTSDHGEGLASHQIAGHGNRLFQEQLRVPLILFASDGSIAPRRIAALVQLVDLYPTLLETLGARVSGLSDELNAASLWPLLRGENTSASQVAYSQRRWIDDDAGEDRAGPVPQSRRNPASSKNLGELFSIQTERYKYLRGESNEQLFDLAADPLELTNIVAQAPEVAARMRALLERRLEYYRARRSESRTQEVSDEMQAELRALGYVD